VEQNDDVDTTENLSTRAHEDDTPENEGKLLSLSSITDEDLREALAPFDVDGSGTIDLLKVRDPFSRPSLCLQKSQAKVQIKVKNNIT